MKKLIRFSLHTTVVLGSYLPTMAQNQSITPASPDASAFAKMANYPVSSNTGLPDISIPFYTIHSGDLQVPITLFYHAGGFKINEKSGSVGLGWSLGTDLEISRSVNGLDDLSGSTGSYMNNPEMTTFDEASSGSVDYAVLNNLDLYALASGATDGKPDKFTYRLLGKTGSFYIQRNSTGYTFVTVPYDNINISFNDYQFVIVDQDGTTYYYGLPGDPGSVSNQAQAGREVTGNISYNGGICAGCNITAWKCMKVDNATRTDSLVFSYASKSMITDMTRSDYIEYYNNPAPCAYIPPYYPNNPHIAAADYPTLLSEANGFQYLASPKYMEYIGGVSHAFHMVWENPSDGNALEDTSYTAAGTLSGRMSQYSVLGLALASIQFRGGAVVFTGTDQLSSVSVQNNGQEIKAMHFFQSLAAPTYLPDAQTANGSSFNGTLYLDSVHFSNGSTDFERYGFLYKSKYCFGSHLKGRDAWGYVNAKTCETQSAYNLELPSFVAPEQISQAYFPYPCPTASTPVTVNIGGYGDEYPDASLIQSGMLSRIYYPTGGFVDFDFEPNEFNVPYTDPQGTSTRLMLGGGLRIQKITYYNGTDLTPLKQLYYTYGDVEDGMGTLLNAPVLQNVSGQPLFGNYHFTQAVYYGYVSTTLPSGVAPSGNFPGVDNTAGVQVFLQNMEYKTTYMPNATLDLSYSGGSPIYYTKVTEYQLDFGKQTGKKVYAYYPVNYFIQFPAPDPQQSNFLPNTDEKYLTENWFLGKLESEAEYKFQTGTFNLVHQTNYEYTLRVQPKWPRVIYSFLYNYFNVTQPGGGNPMDVYFYQPVGTNSNLQVQGSDYITYQSGIPVGCLLTSKVTDQMQDDNGNTFSTITQYYYDNTIYNQPTRMVIYDSKGGYKSHAFKHPYDYGTAPYTSMVALNMLSPVIEDVVTSQAGQELSHILTNYNQINGAFFAPSSKQTSVLGNPLETLVSYDQYDSYANPTSVTDRGGVTKCYLWGYQSRFPVAEVAGLPYSTVQAAGVSQTILDNPSSDNQLLTELNKLRTISAKPYQVKTFTYKPMIGISGSLDEKGLAIYYNYDAYGRLENVQDYQHNVVKRFNYVESGLSKMLKFYTNRPIRGTVCNCYTEPSTGPGNMDIVNGGTNIGGDYVTSDNYVISQLQESLGNGAVSSICTNDTSNHDGLVELSTAMLNEVQTRPAKLMIEFFQNGSIAGTFRFPTADGTVVYGYLPEGQYQVGVSADPAYRGRAVRYYLQPSNGDPEVILSSGTTVTIKRKVNYSISATTEF